MTVRPYFNLQAECRGHRGMGLRNRRWVEFVTLLILGLAEGCEEKFAYEIRSLGGTVTVDRYRTGEVVAVHLGETKARDADLATLQAFKKLEQLSLSGTKVTDAGLIHLRGLSELRELNLRSTGVTDRGLEYVKGLEQLRSLDVSGCGITDAGLVQLKELANLKRLTLSATLVTDAGVMCLKDFPRLQYVCLYESKVTDAGAVKLQKALPGCRIVRSVDDRSEYGAGSRGGLR